MARDRTDGFERWPAAIIKVMMATPPRKNDQDILAYFTRPTRSINHARIKDIRDGKTHGTVTPATAEELAAIFQEASQTYHCIHCDALSDFSELDPRDEPQAY